MGPGDWISAAGLVVSLFGFVFAIQQIRKTKSASEAAKASVEATAGRLSLNHLLVLLPQLRLIEGDLDAAAADDDHRLAIRSLVAYSHTASQIAQLLERENGADHTAMIEKLKGAARQTSAAKSKLVTSATAKPVKVVTKAALECIGELSSDAASLAADIQVRGY